MDDVANDFSLPSQEAYLESAVFLVTQVDWTLRDYDLRTLSQLPRDQRDRLQGHYQELLRLSQVGLRILAECRKADEPST
jgi:hypothetical protein